MPFTILILLIMNDIDIANIKKELAKRKAANYEWKDGGEMTKDDVILRTLSLIHI